MHMKLEFLKEKKGRVDQKKMLEKNCQYLVKFTNP